MFEKQWGIYEPFWISCTKHVLFISRKKRTLCFFLTKLLMKLLKFHHAKMRLTTNTGKIRRLKTQKGGLEAAKRCPQPKWRLNQQNMEHWPTKLWRSKELGTGPTTYISFTKKWNLLGIVAYDLRARSELWPTKARRHPVRSISSKGLIEGHEIHGFLNKGSTGIHYINSAQ